MPTTKDCLEFLLEETPRPEGAVTTTPYRLSSVKRYFPIQTASLRPNPQLLDRGDELRGIEGAVSQLIDGYEPDGALSMRAYLNDLPFLLEISGFADTITAGGALIGDPNATTATGVNALNSTTVVVGSTASFEATGAFILLATNVTYTGKTATTFTGCSAHPATTGGEVITGNVPATAIKHVFNKRTGLVAKSAQLIAAYVDEGVFLKGQGFGISGMTLDAAGNISADLAGMVLQNVADPNITPVWDASTILPIRRGDIFLTWGVGGTGTPDDFSVAISNPLTRRRTMILNPPSFYPDKLEHGDERVRLSGSIPMSTLTDGDIDAMIAASTFAATARWKTTVNILSTQYKYTVWIEMPKCQYVGGAADDLANRRRFGGSFDWVAAWDETLGYDARITVVNSITAIETLV